MQTAETAPTQSATRLMSILVIDDDKCVRLSLVAVLCGVGHNVHEARNGKEGLELAKQAAVDIAIVDMMMPEKDGIETILEIREARPGIKIIAISGASFLPTSTLPTSKLPVGNLLQVAEALGAEWVLEKPFEGEALLAAVSKLAVA